MKNIKQKLFILSSFALFGVITSCSPNNIVANNSETPVVENKSEIEQIKDELSNSGDVDSKTAIDTIERENKQAEQLLATTNANTTNETKNDEEEKITITFKTPLKDNRAYEETIFSGSETQKVGKGVAWNMIRKPFMRRDDAIYNVIGWSDSFDTTTNNGKKNVVDTETGEIIEKHEFTSTDVFDKDADVYAIYGDAKTFTLTVNVVSGITTKIQTTTQSKYTFRFREQLNINFSGGSAVPSDTSKYKSSFNGTKFCPFNKTIKYTSSSQTCDYVVAYAPYQNFTITVGSAYAVYEETPTVCNNIGLGATVNKKLNINYMDTYVVAGYTHDRWRTVFATCTVGSRFQFQFCYNGSSYWCGNSSTLNLLQEYYTPNEGNDNNPNLGYSYTGWVEYFYTNTPSEEYSRERAWEQACSKFSMVRSWADIKSRAGIIDSFPLCDSSYNDQIFYSSNTKKYYKLVQTRSDNQRVYSYEQMLFNGYTTKNYVGYNGYTWTLKETTI